MSKVFVGNLSFKTRETDLKKAFEVCGKVVSATIIFRGPRSMGFGFVEFETPEVAQAAVQTMHHKELDTMTINVEVARPQPQRAPRPQPTAPQQQGQLPQQGQQGQQQQQQQQQQQMQMQPMMRPRRQRNMFPQMYGYPAMPPRGFFRMNMMPPPGFNAMNMMGGMMPPMQQQPPRMMRPRRPRAPRANQDRPLSKATLFVANLPFVVDDSNLKEIFADLNVKEAHVVRTPNGRSRGYGFVEFGSEESRQKALDTLDKVEVEGRVLIIRPALVPPPINPTLAAPQAQKPAFSIATTATTPAAPATTTPTAAPVVPK